MSGDWRAAAHDFSAGASRVWLWGSLGRNDIRQRYSGSLLGSLWITANLALLTLCLTFVFALALGASRTLYAPYVAIGLVLWYFVQSTLADATNVFVASGETIRHSPLPLTVQVLRLVWRNIIVFGHNLVIVPLVLLAFGIVPHWTLLLALLALPMLILNLVAATFVLGLIGARFRDLQQIMNSGLQLLFFATPIVWFPSSLAPGRSWIATANPIFAFIDLIRAPLLGTTPLPTSWPVALVATFATCVVAALAFARLRDRVAYWV